MKQKEPLLKEQNGSLCYFSRYWVHNIAWREKQSIYTFPENTQLGSSLAVRDYNVVMLISKSKALFSTSFCILITSYRRQIIKWLKKVKENNHSWSNLLVNFVEIIPPFNTDHQNRITVLLKGNVYFLLCAQINAIEFSYKTDKQNECQFSISLFITWLYTASKL